jgi:hypothetical protein
MVLLVKALNIRIGVHLLLLWPRLQLPRLQLPMLRVLSLRLLMDHSLSNGALHPSIATRLPSLRPLMVHPLSNAALHPLMATRLLSLRLLIVYPLSNGVLHPLMAPRLLPQVNNLLFLKQLLHRQLPAGMFPLLRSKLLREPIGILGVVLRLAQLGNYADLFTCTLITGLSRRIITGKFVSRILWE